MVVGKSAVTGQLAERSVLSATIQNQTSGPIHCSVEYQTVSGTDNEVIEFDVDNSGEEHKCEEKIHPMSSTSTSDSSYSHVFPKVIHAIQIQKSDGSQLHLKAPFDNVPHDNVRNWKFIVNNEQIRSDKS